MNVRIIKGVLRNGEMVENAVFPLVSGLSKTYNNIGGKVYRWKIAVDSSNSTLSSRRQNCTVFVNGIRDFHNTNDVPSLGRSNVTEQAAAAFVKSDEDLLQEINEKFHTLKLLSEAACKLQIRSMIVSGSPGTGKTYEVTRAIAHAEGTAPLFYSSIIKGTISPIALYIELYNAANGVLVLDDSDSAFSDPEALQLLKAATESTKDRVISYRKMSNALEELGIPNKFIFRGCVIILTNTNLEEARASKAPHYDALISRAHYINAVLPTDREKVLRIRSVVQNSDILNDILNQEEHRQQVVNFIDKYHNRARELSIRMVVKLAEIRGAFGENWEAIAKTTLLK
jgi:hypothetical protein